MTSLYIKTHRCENYDVGHRISDERGLTHRISYEGV